MNISRAKLLLKITGFSFIIVAILAIFGPTFHTVHEITYRCSNAGEVRAVDHFTRMLSEVYLWRDQAVCVLGALLFIAGAITAWIGCVLKNDKNS
jgi:hypothetical protein